MSYNPPRYAPPGAPPPPGNYGHGPGGFAAQTRAPQMPPGADPQLWQWFTAVDADSSGHITVNELQQALVNGDWSPFSLDSVKLLMSIFDTDRSGTIGFNEFSGLWRYIKDWQGVFKHFDADKSGTINGKELHNALSQFGYNLSPPLLDLLEKKYDVLSASAPPNAQHYNQHATGITFDRFVRACVVIKQLTESFQRLDTNRTGSITLNYETFMRTVLSAP